MPSSDDNRIGCKSLCTCIIRLQRTMGTDARIGPGLEAELAPS